MRTPGMNTRLSMTPGFDSFIYGIGGATLLLLPVWAAIFDLRAKDMAWISLIDMSMTTILFALIYLATTRFTRFWRLVACIPLIIIFCIVGYDSVYYLHDSLRNELLNYDLIGENKSILRLLRIVIPLLLLLLIIFGRIKLATIITSTAKFLSIVFIVMVLQFSYLKVSIKENIEQHDAAPWQRPVIVLIFDELDAEILESKIEQLPGFKALAERSKIVGTVFPPSNYTHISLPAMLLGTPITSSSFAGNSIFFTTTADSRPKPLTRADHLFVGMNPNKISLLGWHLPYCGFFKRIERCMDANVYGVPGEQFTTIEWLYGNNSLLFNYRYNKNVRAYSDVDTYADLLFNDPRNFRHKNVGRFLDEMEQRLVTDVGSGKFELIFAHLPCPHLPRIDNGKTRGMLSDYSDNLRRCDRIIDSISRVIDRDGGKSARLIVTSDHWLRSIDWIRNGHPNDFPTVPQQVPFFFFDGENQSPPLRIAGGNNVVLARLVKALVHKEMVNINNLLSEINTFGPEVTMLDKF